MNQSFCHSTVRVGILHSLSGTMAISEAPLIDAELMAIAEINQAGGVLSKQIEPLLEDGASEPAEFERQARKLIQKDQVATVFGCWTSASRKAVLPVFEELNALLWYPVQYEGLECSKNIFYTGSCPNQQVEPAVNWLVHNKGKRFYLVASDYVFPRTVNKLIKAQLKQHSGTVIGEEYVPLGTQSFAEIITRIQQARPDVVFSTINGDSNLAFYRQYRASGIAADEIPIMAVSVAEAELQRIGDAAAGHYASWAYFQSTDTPDNQRFVQNFQRRYGADRVTSDPIEAAYLQVYLWKQAVEAAQSFASDRVRLAAYSQTFQAPGGAVKVESNHHLWKRCQIGQILPTGQFEVVFTSDNPIEPLPWLGVEKANFSASPVVIDMLAEVSQGIQYSWQLEQKSRELKAVMVQLQNEIAERQRVEAVLRDSEAELSRRNAQIARAYQEITLLNDRLKAENLRMSAELDVTRRLQQMLLPKEPELEAIAELEIACFMEPAEEVGGDYYDVLTHNGRVKIGIGDVTGHGLESGVLAIVVQTAVRTLLASNETDPVRFLTVLNQIVYDNLQRMRSDKNLTLSLLDYKERTLHLSGQHEELLVVRFGGKVDRIDTSDLGFPLGLEANIADFVGQTELHLYPGDGVVLYTDGINEAENSSGVLYGVERLCEVVSRNWYASASEIRQAVINDVRQHIGKHRVYDDITLLVLKQK